MGHVRRGAEGVCLGLCLGLVCFELAWAAARASRILRIQVDASDALEVMYGYDFVPCRIDATEERT